MRHRVKGRKLSRTSAHRKATMRALSMALIKEHRISTTVAKAKELRGFVEPLITRAKVDSHHNRKQVFSSLQNNDAVTKLFNEIGPKVGDRPGGYTRIIKTVFRQGDAAEMAIIELVDFNDITPEGGDSTKKKKTRRAGKSNAATSTVEKKTNVEEKKVVEEDDDASSTEATIEDEKDTSEDASEEKK